MWSTVFLTFAFPFGSNVNSVPPCTVKDMGLLGSLVFDTLVFVAISQAVTSESRAPGPGGDLDRVPCSGERIESHIKGITVFRTAVLSVRYRYVSRGLGYP